MGKIKYIFALIIVLSCIGKAKSQQDELIYIDYYSPKEYEVGGIEITGADNLDNSSVILLAGISVGEKITIPSDKFSLAIDRLWKQGIFDDIHIYITKVEGRTVYLEYNLSTKPRLSHFKIEGVSGGEADKIKERLNIAMGDVITENLKSNCRNIIHDYFADKGYYNSQTEISEIKDTASSRKEAHLTFKITKGNKVHIGQINTKGNEYFTDNKIRRQMKNTKENKWWRFWKGSRFIESDYQEDKNKIIEKYNNEGFRDAGITWDTTFITTRPVKKGFFRSIGRGVASIFKKRSKTKDEVIVDMNIYEGKKYYFRNITWVGNTKYTSKELSDRLRINKGDPYNKELLSRNVNYDPTGKDISSLYMDDGYLFFRVTPVEINIENDSIDIEMRIFEGTQARIGNVSISGNTTTNDFVVRRELKTIPGQLFSRDDVMRSIREIQQLGYFNNEKINPKVEPNVQKGTVDITYELSEENSGNQVNVSGGWGGGMLILQGGLALTNFSARKFFNPKAWRPFPVGDGQRIAINLQTNGSYYYGGSLSFTEPWLGGKKPTSLTAGIYYTYQDDSYYYDVSNYHIKILGASVSLGKRLVWPDDYFTLIQGVKYQLYDVQNATSFIMSTGKANNLAYTLTFGRNSIDQPIYPRTGSEFSAEGAFTFPYSLVNGKDYATLSLQDKYRWLEYYKVNIRAAWYMNIVDNLVLSARSRFGFLGRYNNDIDYSPFERFYLGGDGLTGYALDGREVVSLRGYEASALAPDNGATVFDKFTMELRYPITLNPAASVYVLAFAEGGNSWTNFESFAPFKMYRSAGVGVRIFMQMFGLLGFDWGYGFDPAFGETNRSKGHFHISLNGSID
ncbi:MAG: outer membrane protein assembly factor BamA [Bacteroidales bacterium]|nr:outer membrane protein assembly factor BamA [Bacteroidales bacterium]